MGFLTIFLLSQLTYSKAKPWPIVCRFEMWDKVAGTDTQEVVQMRPRGIGFEAQVLQEGHPVRRGGRFRVKKDPTVSVAKSQIYQVVLAKEDDFYGEETNGCRIEVQRAAGDLRKQFFFVMTKDHFVNLARGPASTVGASGEAVRNLNGKTYPSTKNLTCEIDKSVYKQLRDICY